MHHLIMQHPGIQSFIHVRHRGVYRALEASERACDHPNIDSERYKNRTAHLALTSARLKSGKACVEPFIFLSCLPSYFLLWRLFLPDAGQTRERGDGRRG